MEKKVFALAMVMGFGVSAFAQEVKNDSTVCDSTVCDSTALAFCEPTDSTVTDSTSLAFYEPTDTTVCDSTGTCPSKAELALAANRKYNGAEYDKAVAVEEDNVFAAIFKRENEMA